MMKSFFRFGRKPVEQYLARSDKICRRRGLSVERLEPRQLLAVTGGTDSFAYFLDKIDDANVALTMPAGDASTAISTVIGEARYDQRQKWTSDWRRIFRPVTCPLLPGTTSGRSGQVTGRKMRLQLMPVWSASQWPSRVKTLQEKTSGRLSATCSLQPTLCQPAVGWPWQKKFSMR